MVMMTANERLCVALDVGDVDEARTLVTELQQSVGVFKVGLELFTAAGPALVSEFADRGLRVFLDLKFHDIPTTVAGAARAATRLGVAMFNVHASGGRAMIMAAVEASAEAAHQLGRPRPVVLAVTVLTSIDARTLESELLISRDVQSTVAHLAVLAKEAGADGVVASPQETKIVRKVCGDDFLIVTPGVRPAGATMDDQKRVSTPGDAIRDGADYVVLGRPIVGAPDRGVAVRQIIAEMRLAQAS